MAPRETQLSSQMSVQNWLLLIAVSIIWAGSFLFVEIALTVVPFFSIMAARVTIGTFGLYLMLKMLGEPTRGPAGMSTVKLWQAFLLLGVINNVIPFSLIAWSQTHLDMNVASILNATMPLFVVFLAHFFTQDEKVTWRRFTGVFVGFLGVMLIVSQDGFNWGAGGTLGKFGMLGAAFSYAVAVLIGRHYGKLGLKPLTMAWGQSFGAMLVALPLAGVLDQPWGLISSGAMSLQVWASLIGLGLLCSSVAYALYFKLVASAGATNTSLVTLLVSPFAIILGAVFLGESLALHQGLGMLAIAAGLLIIDGRLQAWFFVKWQKGS